VRDRHVGERHGVAARGAHRERVPVVEDLDAGSVGRDLGVAVALDAVIVDVGDRGGEHRCGRGHRAERLAAVDPPAGRRARRGGSRPGEVLAELTDRAGHDDAVAGDLDHRGGELTRRDPKEFLFFTRTPNGRGAAKEYLARLEERTDDRDKAISVRSFRAQLKAIHRWGQQKPADLTSIHQPVLVMNGESDKMVPTKNTVDLDRRLPNSQLVVYPDAGHGGVFQFHEDFVKRALEFL
jgi:pimeloyl-ACP methyl ester carboxylesterase